ncbi:MAG: prolyl oligopeptidase family serine peptidase [Sphingomicrobium sp.]
MRITMGLIAILSTSPAIAVVPMEPSNQPPAAVARPVTDDYFGTKVTDRFRYMESRDAETTAWMKAQSQWTHGLLDSIAPKQAYLKTMSDFGAQFGLVSTTALAGGKTFYLEHAPGADQFNLKVQDGAATRTLVDTVEIIKSTGAPHAIDWIAPSPDGSKIAVGISSGGSENSEMTVLDVASGKTIAGPIDRAQFGGVSWLSDGAGLFFPRLQKLGPHPKPTDKYQNITADFWGLSGDTKPLVGPTIKGGPITDPNVAPLLVQIPHSDAVLLVAVNGVENEVKLWWGKRDAVRSGKERWTPLADTPDGITRFDSDGHFLYLLTHKDAPRFKLVAVPVGGSLAQAKTLVGASDDRLVENIAAAKDGVYVAVRNGLNSELLRVSPSGESQSIALPVHGSIESLASDPDAAGAVIGLDSWATPLAHYRYDPGSRALVDLNLDKHPPIDAARYAVTELMATAKDGTKVPLTVIGPSGPVRPRPMLIDAYGAYGISSFPFFGTRTLPYIDAGVSRAECAVRGGGEFGEAWRLGGKGATKPNTWRDAIACAETLIARGYTTPDMLFITGTSAGGIMVGRAATERPDLFAGAIARVGDVNALRMETMAAGPANIPEFGTVKDRQGFKDLYEMDAYQHVVPGKTYPAFMITGGLNDPRVEPWEGAKFAARLEEMPNHRPVLYRLEEQAGHGLGTTKSTRDAEEADMTAFILWRAGAPAWQPAHSN